MTESSFTTTSIDGGVQGSDQASPAAPVDPAGAVSSPAVSTEQAQAQAAADSGVPTASSAPAADQPGVPEHTDQAPKKTNVGDVVAYKDFDYVTDTTTVRHGVIIGRSKVVDGKGNEVDALEVAFLGTAVTLPAAAFDEL